MPIVRPARERLTQHTSEEAIADGDRIMRRAQDSIDDKRRRIKMYDNLLANKPLVRLPVAIVRLRPLGWWNRIKGWFQ
jgi:hypothetical protein